MDAAQEPERTSDARCDDAPIIRAVGGAFVVVGACATAVALYRRDVVSDERMTFVGICRVPCIDADVSPEAVYAYVTARLEPVVGAVLAGPDSPETYVTLDPGSPP